LETEPITEIIDKIRYPEVITTNQFLNDTITFLSIKELYQTPIPFQFISQSNQYPRDIANFLVVKKIPESDDDSYHNVLSITGVINRQQYETTLDIEFVEF